MNMIVKMLRPPNTDNKINRFVTSFAPPGRDLASPSSLRLGQGRPGWQKPRHPRVLGDTTSPYCRAVTVKMWQPAYDKKFQNIYHSKLNMYRLFDFLYKRMLPLYIKSNFLNIRSLI